MKAKFITLLLLAHLISIAQAPSWKWAKRAGGAGHDYGTRVSADGQANCYATGYFDAPSFSIGNSTFTTSNQGMFVAKYDSTGNVIWAKAANSISSSSGAGIKTDANGNSYLIGSYNGSTLSLGTSSISSQSGSAFITKLDASGNVIWLKNAGYYHTNPNGGLDIGIDAAGNSYVTGPATTYTSFPADSLILSKYDNAGNVVWKKYAAGTNWSMNSIATDPAGNSYVAGILSSGSLNFYGAIVTNTINGAMIFVAKYDPSGNLIWAKAEGKYPSLYYPSICIDGNGNSYVSGYFIGNYAGFGSTILTNNNLTSGSNDIFIVKFDNQGNIVWAKGAGGGNADLAYGIASDTQGGIYITGMYWNSATFGGNTIYASGGPEIFVAKYDQSGNGVWAKSAGGSGVDVGSGICTGPNNNVFITGNFFSNRCIFGKDTLVNCDTISGPSEIFVARIGANGSVETGVAEQNLNENLISLFPNPFVNETTLKIKDRVENATLVLYNSAGQQVKKVTGIKGQEYKLSRDDLVPGIYFMILSEKDQPLITHKLVIGE